MKLFIFAVGGTGARVLRSLTMLLASGVELPNCDRVVPIIIDPDAHNGDMNRTVALLQSYQQVHRRLGQQLQGQIVVHVAVDDFAAMPVAGVFAVAHVGHHQKLRHFTLDGASCLLHDAVVRPNASVWRPVTSPPRGTTQGCLPTHATPYIPPG